MKSWRRECEILREENAKLISEIRNLRCVMVEAAASINPTEEPTLFSQLTGSRGYFIDDRNNPYPEHARHVSEQYLRALTELTEEFGGYNSEFGNRDSSRQQTGRFIEDGKF